MIKTFCDEGFLEIPALRGDFVWGEVIPSDLIPN